MKPTILLIDVLAGYALITSSLADVPIAYSVPLDGRTSLAIYDQDGRMVHTLLTGKPLAKGEHTVTWDGLDRYGRALPAGEYTWKLLATEGLRAEFITQVGQNPNPVWEKGVCNHESPMAAAVDATGVYRIGTFDEGAHAGAKTDLNGRYLWTTDRDKVDPWCQFGAALTVIDDRLFELIHNGTVYRYDARSGRCLTSGNGEGLWNLRWEGGPAKIDGKEGEKVRRYVETTGMDLSAASSAKLLVASYRQHNAVRWFDTDSGKQVAEASVPEPFAIAAKPDGIALVISKGAVVAVSRDGNAPKTIIPANQLQSPWRLCVSSASGDIFVAENSPLAQGVIERPKKDFESGEAQDLSAGVIAKTSATGQHHQVKRFSADGKLLGKYGNPEGRQDGAYVAADFRGITDIEADHEGGFVLTEGHHQPPRRSARFDSQGQLLREWFGAQQYGINAVLEPGNPQYVWIHASASQGAMMRCRVDYAKKMWTIVEIYRDCLARNLYWGGGHQLFRIVAREGRLHFFSAVGPTAFLATMYDPVRKTMRVTNASDNKQKGGEFWNDLNDDGMPQPDEVARFGQSIGGSVAGPDFTLFTTSQSSSGRGGPKLTPKRFTAGGTPVFELDKNAIWPEWNENGDRYRCWDIVAASDGGWFGCFSDAFKAAHDNGENHGSWYGSSCSGIDRLVNWDRNWRQVWSVGRHGSDFDHEIGSQSMPRGLVGATHGCIVWADASDSDFSRSSVWTDDGLYVDELLRMPIDSLPKELHGLQNGLEYTLGQVTTDPSSGDVLYSSVNTGGGSPIYRITGWKGWHRQSGKINLAATATGVAKRDGTGLKGEYFNNTDCSGEPVLTRKDSVVFFHWIKNVDSLPPGLSTNGFSCRWTGQIEAPTTDKYRLVLETMTPWRGGGWGIQGKPAWMKIWLGGNLIMDTATGLYKETTYAFPNASMGLCRDVLLQAGERYDFRMECSYAGNAVAKLCWETPSLDRRAILPEFLHPEPGPKREVEIPVEKRPEVIADFGFEESDGFLSRSRTGGDLFGRLTGNTRRVPGRTGRAIEFDAKGAYDTALFPIDEELRLPDSNYTIAFWFKTSANNVRLCEAKRYSGYNNRWSDHIVSLDQGKVRFQLQGDQALETSAAFNDHQWHHVVTTVGVGGQRLHVDSQLIATGKLTKRTKSSNRLGLDLGPGAGNAVVEIDELKVLGRSLSSVEITSLAK